MGNSNRKKKGEAKQENAAEQQPGPPRSEHAASTTNQSAGALADKSDRSLTSVSNHRRKTAAQFEDEVNGKVRTNLLQKTTPNTSNESLKTSFKNSGSGKSFEDVSTTSPKEPVAEKQKVEAKVEDKAAQSPPAAKAKVEKNNSKSAPKEKEYFISEEDPNRRVDRAVAQQLFAKALSKSSLLKNTSEELREELFKNAAVPVFVNEGDVLFEQDTTGHLLFVLVEGKFQAQMRVKTAKGKSDKEKPDKVKKKKLKAGHAVAEHCVLMNSPHEFTLEATKNGMVLALHRVQYQMISLQFADKMRLEQVAADDVVEEKDEFGLASIPLFAPLGKQQLKMVRESLKEQRYKINERLVASKQVIPGIYIIKSGQVAVRAPRVLKSKDLQQKPTATPSFLAKRGELFSEAEHDEIEWLTRGDYFGEAALLSDDAQLGVDVVCSSEEGVSVMLLEKKDWNKVLDAAQADGVFLEAIKLIHVTRLINQSPAFSNLDETQIKNLVAMLEFKTYEANAKIMEGGSPVTPEGGMYLVTQGAVCLLPFQKLKQKDSQMEIEKRAQMMRQNSRMVISSRFKKTAQSTPVMSQTERTASHETLAKGSSFIGLSPAMFGRQMTEATLYQLNSNTPNASPLAAAATEENPSEISQSQQPVLTTSIDHEALFVSLGVGDRGYVVLLGGELFGENGISQNETERVAKASVFAVGRVTVAYISLPLLEQMQITDLVRASVLDAYEAKELKDELAGQTQEQSEEILSRLENAKKLAEQYLNEARMKELEIKVQHNSIMRKEGHAPRRESTTFRMAAKRLFAIRQLHKTPVVDVTLSMHDPSCQVLVVKELDVAEANKEGMGNYLLSEQVVLAQISSSFVANMISSWEEPERLFLGLEPALVGDLGSLLSKTLEYPKGNDYYPSQGELGGFNLDFIRFVSACMVLALKHLFEHHVIHRDIKPNNIVVDQFGYCKLVDFGIAKRLPAGTNRTYSLCGSPRYMSPELVDLAFHGTGNPYTNAVDWWALGITLVELATGRLPYADGLAKRNGTEREKKEGSLIQVLQYKRDVLAASRAAHELNHSYSIFDSHSWFKAFRDSTNKGWKDFGRFAARILHPDPDTRMGSATSKRGPREALDQPLFAGIRFDRLAQRKAIAPFLPKKVMVDLDKAKEEATSLRLANLEKRRKKQQEDAAAAAARMANRPARPTLHRAKGGNVETRVRANLEHPDMNNEKMNDAISKTDQARKQMIMARDQHIRRIAFKQGFSLEDIDAHVPGKTRNKLLVLQRAAVLETLQVFVQAGGSSRTRRQLAAIRIQTFWRGHHARVMLLANLRAAFVLQRLARRYFKRKNEAAKLESPKVSADTVPPQPILEEEEKKTDVEVEETKT